MAVDDASEDRAECPWGWCGLCQSFTEFPHDCKGEVQAGGDLNAA
ncbi:MAG TPA: hypothetical protein VME46_13485 [Acidimicrobiales bacterium]|nr:hypothetical protein [Acidimicrobiales bacterium]